MKKIRLWNCSKSAFLDCRCDYAIIILILKIFTPCKHTIITQVNTAVANMHSHQSHSHNQDWAAIDSGSGQHPGTGVP